MFETSVLPVYSFNGLTNLKVPVSADIVWPVPCTSEDFEDVRRAYLEGLELMGYIEPNEVIATGAIAGANENVYLELPHQKHLQKIKSAGTFAAWAILLILNWKPHVIFCNDLHDLLIFHREYFKTIELARY